MTQVPNNTPCAARGLTSAASRSAAIASSGTGRHVTSTHSDVGQPDVLHAKGRLHVSSRLDEWGPIETGFRKSRSASVC